MLPDTIIYVAFHQPVAGNRKQSPLLGTRLLVQPEPEPEEEHRQL